MKDEKDPKVKLTLSVKKSVIEKAKRYAAQQGTSVSHLIETHLSDFQHVEKDEFEQYASIADQVFGCAKGGPLSRLTDQEIKDLMVKDKFGV